MIDDSFSSSPARFCLPVIALSMANAVRETASIPSCTSLLPSASKFRPPLLPALVILATCERVSFPSAPLNTLTGYVVGLHLHLAFPPDVNREPVARHNSFLHLVPF